MPRKRNGVDRRAVLGWSVGGAVALGWDVRVVYNETAPAIRKTAELRAIT